MSRVFRRGEGRGGRDSHTGEPDDHRYLSEGSMARLWPERDTGAVSELNTGD